MKNERSRGIHVVWSVDPKTFELDETTGELVMEPYMRSVKAVEPKAGNLESLRRFSRSPMFASKLFLQSLVLHAMHGVMQGAILDVPGRERLGVAFDHLACTLTREDVMSFQKCVGDCQPLVHRWMSPHHKSGLVARSIVDRAGELRKEYLRLERVRSDSSVTHVAETIGRDPERFAPAPGFVPLSVVEAACEPGSLGPAIAMLLSRGLVNCCNMAPTEYASSWQWFKGLLEDEKNH